ncbi:hypothetical protein E2562_004375 [Oryza meyeriana var. granulata]|uniref:Uncharacterized protein n=1 Tax=Oryza meyeriana var. granulata TaxID=110450 RepID=A0A6G1CY87_9ORYZ|nr:hypothetical protein E2562_004375 [Oryza meyeriana var. granulata]
MLVDMYKSLTTNNKTAAASGIVGELQNRSTHLLAVGVVGGWRMLQIKADMEAKAGLINHLLAPSPPNYIRRCGASARLCGLAGPTPINPW